MVPSAHDVLLGDRFERNLDLLAVVVLSVGTFVAYATDLFAVAGGVIVLPGDATIVGAVAAALIGYGRGALLPAWLCPFGAYLGFNAEWAFLGLSSSHSLVDRLIFLFDPVTLALFGAASILIGSLAFGVGTVLSLGVDRVRDTHEG